MCQQKQLQSYMNWEMRVICEEMCFNLDEMAQSWSDACHQRPVIFYNCWLWLRVSLTHRSGHNYFKIIHSFYIIHAKIQKWSCAVQYLKSSMNIIESVDTFLSYCHSLQRIRLCHSDGFSGCEWIISVFGGCWQMGKHAGCTRLYIAWVSMSIEWR